MQIPILMLGNIDWNPELGIGSRSLFFCRLYTIAYSQGPFICEALTPSPMCSRRPWNWLLVIFSWRVYLCSGETLALVVSLSEFAILGQRT